KEDVGGLVGIAPGRDIEVEPQRSGRNAQLARQALGPVGMVRAIDGHGRSSGFRAALRCTAPQHPTESRQTRASPVTIATATARGLCSMMGFPSRRGPAEREFAQMISGSGAPFVL